MLGNPFAPGRPSLARPSFGLVIALFLAGDAAIACRMAPCAPQEPVLVTENAQLLFRGRLRRILSERGREVTPFDLRKLDSCCRGILEFEVLDVWQGDVAPELQVRVSFQNGINCERSYFVGEIYVLWSFAATSDDQVATIENCHGIGRGGWPEEATTDVETFIRALGPPKWSSGDQKPGSLSRR